MRSATQLDRARIDVTHDHRRVRLTNEQRCVDCHTGQSSTALCNLQVEIEVNDLLAQVSRVGRCLTHLLAVHLGFATRMRISLV